MEAPTCVSSAPSAAVLEPVATTVGQHVVPLSILRSDYDGDDVYADWDEPTDGGPPTLLRAFEPGIGRVEPWTASGGANTAYYYTDLLGTTRLMTGANGQLLPSYGTVGSPTPTVFTAFGEHWHWAGGATPECYYGMTWAKEFRYDSPRERYLSRDLDPIAAGGGQYLFISENDRWSDYDPLSEGIYGDWHLDGDNVSMDSVFEPGIWQGNGYVHTDLLGTKRMWTDEAGTPPDDFDKSELGNGVLEPLREADLIE